MEPCTGSSDVIGSTSVKVYQNNSDKTFIMKRPLQHLVLLEATIKKPANESQRSRREAAFFFFFFFYQMIKKNKK